MKEERRTHRLARFGEWAYATTIMTKEDIKELVDANRLYKKVCPRCGKALTGHPALSRYADIDICPICGTDEAVEAYRNCGPVENWSEKWFAAKPETKFALLQIDLDKDKNGIAFEGYDRLINKGGVVDESIYKFVYADNMPANGLEGIYQKFNVDKPSDFTGRSMSVSDIVLVFDYEVRAFYCDTISFREISFDLSKASWEAER